MLNASFRHPEEVGQQVVTGFREHALGMELHALEMGMFAVTQSHHGVVLKPSSDFKAGRKAAAFSDQAVIASGGEGLRQASEDPFASMEHR